MSESTDSLGQQYHSKSARIHSEHTAAWKLFHNGSWCVNMSMVVFRPLMRGKQLVFFRISVV